MVSEFLKRNVICSCYPWELEPYIPSMSSSYFTDGEFANMYLSGFSNGSYQNVYLLRLHQYFYFILNFLDMFP
jgi:hypothetical protein